MPSRTILHLQWDGPYAYTSVTARESLERMPLDLGLYQIYGQHPVYGPHTLLYLGLACDLPIADQLLKDGWVLGGDPRKIEVYAGRLAGSATPPLDRWRVELLACHHLLVRAHLPALNNIDWQGFPDQALREVVVLNWGSYRELFPEVSGDRWTRKFDEIPGYTWYGDHPPEGSTEEGRGPSPEAPGASPPASNE